MSDHSVALSNKHSIHKSKFCEWKQSVIRLPDDYLDSLDIIPFQYCRSTFQVAT